MTEKVISAFQIVKDQVAHHTSRINMNAHDPLILYTDRSTRAIGGVLMQFQGGKEKPCLFLISQVVRPSNQVCGGSDGAGTLCFCFCFLRE